VEVLQGNQTRSGRTHFEGGWEQFGFDFDIPEGEPVLAARGGTVTYVQDNYENNHCGGWKLKDETNLVIVDHGDGTSGQYLHLQKGVSVERGQVVVQGQILGRAGKTGATGCTPHLHFQVQENDSEKVLPDGTEIKCSWSCESISICFANVPGCVPQEGQTYHTLNQVVMVEGIQVTREPTSTIATEPGPSLQPDPLDREDSTSVIQWIQYALQTSDISVLNVLAHEDVIYAKSIEGSQIVAKEEFLNQLSSGWTGGPYCEAYALEDDTLRVWTGGWSPPWEMTELCYDGCQDLQPPWQSETAAFFLSETSEGWAIEAVWLNERSIWQELYGTPFTSCDDVQVTSGPSLADPAPDERDQIGPNSVWDIPSNAVPAVQDCLFRATSIPACMENAMESRGVHANAIDFARSLDWQAILVSFTEYGTVDIGVVIYPTRANNNRQMVMLNGLPSIVFAEDAWELELDQAPGYETLPGSRDEFIMWASEQTLEASQSLVDGGQRFVFSHPLYKGCHACGIGGYALSAFVFDSSGQLIGRALLGAGSSKPTVPNP
jgi:hypothetical protein